MPESSLRWGRTAGRGDREWPGPRLPAIAVSRQPDRVALNTSQDYGDTLGAHARTSLEKPLARRGELGEPGGWPFVCTDYERPRVVRRQFRFDPIGLRPPRPAGPWPKERRVGGELAA